MNKMMRELLELSFHQNTKKKCNLLYDVHTAMTKMLTALAEIDELDIDDYLCAATDIAAVVIRDVNTCSD